MDEGATTKYERDEMLLLVNDVAPKFVYKALLHFSVFDYATDDVADIVQEFMVLVMTSDFDLSRGYGFLKVLARRAVIEWRSARNLVRVPRRTSVLKLSSNPLRVSVVSLDLYKSRPPITDRVDSKLNPDCLKVLEAVSRLHPTHQEIVRQVYGMDEPLTPIADIARESEVSRATVRVKLAKALTRVREWMTRTPKICIECGNKILLDKRPKFCSTRCKDRHKKRRLRTAKEKPPDSSRNTETST